MYKYIPLLLIISLILADIIMYGGIIKLFFNMDTTIIAGVIGFVGAVLGGIITYAGVNKTIKHRDREIFMNSATEKLMINDNLINRYKYYLNTVFLLEHSNVDTDIKKKKALEIIEKIVINLDEDNLNLYKCMDYDALKILDFHKKSLNRFIGYQTISMENMNDCFEKVRSIFQVLSVNKAKLEDNYYKYKTNYFGA